MAITFFATYLDGFVSPDDVFDHVEETLDATCFTDIPIVNFDKHVPSYRWYKNTFFHDAFEYAKIRQTFSLLLEESEGVDIEFDYYYANMISHKEEEEPTDYDTDYRRRQNTEIVAHLNGIEENEDLIYRIFETMCDEFGGWIIISRPPDVNEEIRIDRLIIGEKGKMRDEADSEANRP